MICPPQDEFQIGWICALPIEAAAAKEMLDESFGFLDEQDTTDPNIYTLGRIGKHYIVIACLPAGQYGNTAATIVANNMIRTFSKSLRVGLMVGVGGGIPSTMSDIRLGDIVISCPTGNCGGVLQYDMGKVGVDGKFTRTGSLNSPPRSLLAAVSAMRAAELTDDPHYPEYFRNAIGRTRRTQKAFTRPGQQSDRLFQIQHDHPAAADNCDICPREWEETRNEREDNEPQPHYGIIASGNSVIKHGWTREQLRMQTGALCFEMEAAGLMLDFPCIVIRGICDYSDSHKNKEWQGYAALAAASYTKELLGYIPKGQIGLVFNDNMILLIWHFVGSLENLNEKVKGTNERLDKAYDQREQYHAEQTARVLTTRQKECHQTEDQNQLIQRLKDFHSQTSLPTQKNWLKFLVTSRPYDDIQNSFKSITDLVPHIHLQGEQENNQIHQEIDLVVKVKVKELIETSGLPADVAQRIQDQLLQMQHRMYLWLYLAIDDIRTTFQNSLRPATESIILVPPSVNAAYEKILSRVPSGQKDIPTDPAQNIHSNYETRIEKCRKSNAIKNNQNLIFNASYHIQQSTGLNMFEGCPPHNSRKWLICGWYGNALQAASYRGYEQIVQILLDKGADANTQSGVYGNALQAACYRGHEQIVQMLLDNKADVNAQGGHYGNALLAASYGGHEQIVQILLDNKADVNAQGGQYGNALQAASCVGHEHIMRMLLNNKANIDAQSGQYGNALQAASYGGHEQIVQILLDNKADVNAQGGEYGNALQAASYRGYEQIVWMLLDNKADANAQGGAYGNALQAASYEGHEQIVQMLLDNKADVNAQGGAYGNALQAASCVGHEQIVRILLDHQSHVDEPPLKRLRVS
ncbi:uncharacterized protein BDW43DRAFT_321300 [Aspergillus alliaceus]|uniref:uncharacterized protein n=1 Tax=Petromyces alliaceus TaxID=209559 RepID=UPI0012A70EB9|nr:uncharacterized protein BDW43DRAFT_321300 [Aspergillus alliaceus]KAB8238262.1 hypothetical protein BDW43DRAFT_321300 [Aspergillus alliaceus]